MLGIRRQKKLFMVNMMDLSQKAGGVEFANAGIIWYPRVIFWGT
jgi:hypothetical protein